MGPDFYSKLASIKTGTKFPQLKDGTYIISTGEKEGVNNVLVFTNGKIENPSISQVIKINLDTETEIAPIRHWFTNYLKEGLNYDSIVEAIENNARQELFSRYQLDDFANQFKNKEPSRQFGGNNGNNQLLENRAGSSGKNTSEVQNNINTEQHQVRNTKQGLGVVTRRDVIALLDKHSETLNRFII